MDAVNGTTEPLFSEYGRLQVIVISRLFYICAVLWLLSLIAFALLRLFTGISIKRLGYFSLKNVSLTPRQGVEIRIETIGIRVHRPTVASPGWVSFYLDNVEYHVTTEAIATIFQEKPEREGNMEGKESVNDSEWVEAVRKWGLPFIHTQSKLVQAGVKWILPRLGVFDITSNSLSLHLDRSILVCTGFTVLLDLRNARSLLSATFVGTLDTHKVGKDEMRFNVNLQIADLYLADGLEDENPTQLLKQFTTNFAGVLSKKDFLIKEIAFQVGFGRVSIPVGRLKSVAEPLSDAFKQPPKSVEAHNGHDPKKAATVGIIVLSLVSRIEIKITSAEILDIPAGPARLAISIKDLALDLSRMNPQSPGFKLSYSDNDVAHQCIFTVSSVNFGADYGDYQEELLYVPLLTVLTRGNIFSKTLRYVQNITEMNVGRLRTQVSIHNPTFNVEQHQLKFLQKILDFMRNNEGRDVNVSKTTSKWTLPFQLLPQTLTSVIVTDAAARLVLGSEKIKRDTMFIASLSRLQVSLWSTHDAGAYGIHGSLEFTEFLIWFRSEAIKRVEIMKSSEICMQVTATTHPKLSIELACNIGQFRVTLIQYEIFRVLRELGLLIYPMVPKGEQGKSKNLRGNKQCFLRRLPKWITVGRISATDTCLVVASDQFRSKNRDMLGIKLMARTFEIQINGSPSKNQLIFNAKDILLLKFDDLLMNQFEDPNVESMAEILNCPSLKVNMMTCEMNDAPVTKVGLEMPEVAGKFNISLLLAAMVIQEVLNLAMASDLRPEPSQGPDMESELGSESVTSSQEIYVLDDAVFENVRLKVDLPSYDQVMIELCGCTLSHIYRKSPSVSARTIRMYSQSPYDRLTWVPVLSFSRPSLKIQIPAIEGQDLVLLDVGTIRVNVPFNFKVYRIIDHGITLAKAARTLLWQTRTGKWDYILDPHAIPKLPIFPRIRIKSSLLLLSLENDFFESELKLGMETLQVASRHMDYKVELFERKVKVLLQHELATVNQSSNEESSSRRPRTSSDTTRVKHAVTIAASAVREATHRKSSKKWHTQLGSEEKSSACRCIEELLNTPMELTVCPEPKVQEMHPWIKFWSSPKLAKLRDSLKVAPEDDSDNDKAVSIVIIRERLLEHCSRLWKYSIDSSRQEQSKGVSKRFPEEPFDARTCEKEKIAEYSDKPLLLAAQFYELDLLVDRSRCSDTVAAHDWLYDLGKGLPKNTEFSIWLPMHLDLRAKGGVRVDLLDFPLPILHFPELAKHQDFDKTVAFQLKGDLMITEELIKYPSNIRRLHVPLKLVAPELRHKVSVDVLEVHRTLAPVKTYTNLRIHVGSEYPTRVTWCSSYKAAFHSVGLGFSGFTKPPIDRSPGLGFWDKIRLTLHARFSFLLPESPLYLMLKGGRGPHDLLRENAGFAFVWRNNVNVAINQSGLAKDLFVVDSEQFETVVPDFMTWENDYLHQSPAGRAKGFKTDYNAMKKPEKTVFLFGDKIQWKLGVLCEKTISELERTTSTSPHWEVNLCMPEFVDDIDNYDAYRDFRTENLFLAISVSSLSGTGNNHAYLSPGTFSHFTSWKSQFGAIDPPLRSGSLYPSVRVANHIAFSAAVKGVQYQMTLSLLSLAFFHPLYNTGSGHERRTGLKTKVDKFVFDLHQRREPSETGGRWKMHLHLGEVDLQNVDLRVVEVKKNVQSLNTQLRNLKGTQSANVSSDGESGYESSWQTSSNQQNGWEQGADSASYAPHHTDETAWIDDNDYIELGQALVESYNKPSVHVYPLLFTPRLSYFRRSDLSERTTGKCPDGKLYRKFDEVVHDCLLSAHHLENIQAQILASRQSDLADHLTDLRTSLDSLQLSPETSAVAQRKTQISELITIGEASYDVLSRELLSCLDIGEKMKVIHEENLSKAQDEDSEVLGGRSFLQKNDELERMESEPFGVIEYATSRDGLDELASAKQRSRSRTGNESTDASDFKETAHYVNRLIVHAVRVKWNNVVRDLLFRLRLSVEGTKELRHDLSRTVIRYLEDLVRQATRCSKNGQDGQQYQDEEILEDLLDVKRTDCNLHETFSELEKSNQPDESTEKSVSVLFITPRIQLVSEKNKDHCILLTSRDIEVRVVSALSASLKGDEDVSAEIEKRYGVFMRDTSMIALAHEDVSDTGVASLCLESDGMDEVEAKTSWPPWLTLEICYQSDIMANFEILRRTQLGLRYIQPNSLHVQSREESTGPTVSRLEINAPKLELAIDSVQFYAFYAIATDLLVYKDPVLEDLEKALERIILTTDYNEGFTSSLEHIKQLQRDLRTARFLQEKCNLHTRIRKFDGEENIALLKLEREYRRGSMRLVLLIRAFRSGLSEALDRQQVTTKQVLSVLVKNLLVYGLNERGSPFVRLQLSGSQFSRVSSGEDFSINRAIVSDITGQNMIPKSVYPNMIGRSLKSPNSKDQHMIRVQWTNMDPVGGIPVVDNVEVQLAPIRLQLERIVADKLMDFAFPIKNLKDGSESESSRTISNVYEDVDVESSSNYSLMSKSSSRSSKQEKGHSHLSKRFHLPKIWHGTKSHDHMDKMIDRASNYLNIVSLRIFETELYLSYKGRSSHNILDVQDIEIPLSEMRFNNRMWTKLDLIMHLKREVIKTLLSRSGSILGNRFVRHRSESRRPIPLSIVEDEEGLLVPKHRLRDSSDTQEAKAGKRSSKLIGSGQNIE